MQCHTKYFKLWHGESKLQKYLSQNGNKLIVRLKMNFQMLTIYYAGKLIKHHILIDNHLVHSVGLTSTIYCDKFIIILNVNYFDGPSNYKSIIYSISCMNKLKQYVENVLHGKSKYKMTFILGVF